MLFILRIIAFEVFCSFQESYGNSFHKNENKIDWQRFFGGYLAFHSLEYFTKFRLLWISNYLQVNWLRNSKMRFLFSIGWCGVSSAYQHRRCESGVSMRPDLHSGFTHDEIRCHVWCFFESFFISVLIFVDALTPFLISSVKLRTYLSWVTVLCFLIETSSDPRFFH